MALVIYTVLDFVAKLTITNLNKDFLNTGWGVGYPGHRFMKFPCFKKIASPRVHCTFRLTIYDIYVKQNNCIVWQFDKVALAKHLLRIVLWTAELQSRLGWAACIRCSYYQIMIPLVISPGLWLLPYTAWSPFNGPLSWIAHHTQAVPKTRLV